MKVAEWVKAAWQKITPETIVRSFTCTGILRQNWDVPLDVDQTHSRLKEVLTVDRDTVDMTLSDSDDEDIVDFG